MKQNRYPVPIRQQVPPGHPLTMVRRKQVEARTGLCRSTIYQQIKEGTFPPPIHIGKKAVRWVEADIDAWLQARIVESRNLTERGE